MEFTTHLGLHSQATRLTGGSIPGAQRRRRAWHPLWDKPLSGGLAPSQTPENVASHTPHFPIAGKDEGFGAGLGPVSLAATQGIPVGFFSSA